MKEIRILKAIGGLDDELLAAYEKDTGKPKRAASTKWVRGGAAAACLCLLVAGALTLPRLMHSDQPAPPVDTDMLLPGQASASPAERPHGDNALIVDGSGYGGSSASYITPEPGTTLFFMEVRSAMEEHRGADARLFLAMNAFDADGQPLGEGDALVLETERLASLGYEIGWYEAWTFEREGEKVPYAFLYGLFSVEELETFAASDDYGYAFYFAHNGDGSAVKYAGTGDTVSGDVMTDSVPLPTTLTEAEAYAAIGAFLPTAAPDGFIFESAYFTHDAGISATWTRDLESLAWRVYDYGDAEDAARLTSAAETENYDLSLYPIPWAHSVPKELRQIVSNPIFPIDELTQEVVNARAYLSGEPGEGEAYRMMFSVLYGDMVVEAGCSVSSARVAVHLLEERGLISISPDYKDAPGGGKWCGANYYEVLEIPEYVHKTVLNEKRAGAPAVGGMKNSKLNNTDTALDDALPF